MNQPRRPVRDAARSAASQTRDLAPDFAHGGVREDARSVPALRWRSGRDDASFLF